MERMERICNYIVLFLGVDTLLLGGKFSHNIDLSDGDDLNEIVTKGVYRKRTDGTSVVIENSPFGNKGFVLWYISPYTDMNSYERYGLQIIFSYSEIYIRKHAGVSNWGEWTKLF